MIAVAALLAAVFPVVYTDPYYMTIIVTAEIILILNISWNFILGMAGVWNFGQLAIYALGAYGSGYVMLHYTSVPAGIAILLGGVLSAGISFLLAIPTLRLFGIYTALLTFSFAQMGLTPMSIDVTMLVIGGLGTVTGPIIGTAIVTVIQTKLINYPGWTLTVLGAALLVIVVFVPGGFVGLISRINRRISTWVSEGEEEPPPGDPEPDQRLPA